MIDPWFPNQTTLDVASPDAKPVKLNGKDTRYFDLQIGAAESFE